MRTRKILSPEARAEFEEKMRRRAEAAGEGGGEPKEGTGERRKIRLPQSTGGQPAAGPVPPRAEPFEQRYRRVTTYLEKPLHARVQELRRSGRVASVTALYNAALREYINRYYGAAGE